jgi:hypothetical protein
VSTIKTGVALRNDSYDPSGDTRLWRDVTDGMVYDGSAWRHIEQAMVYDGSAWHMVNPTSSGDPSFTYRDDSHCDARGNAPTFPPIYLATVLLSGDPGLRYKIYWYKNGTLWQTTTGTLSGSGTGQQTVGPGGISDNDLIRVKTRGWGWMESEPSAPSAPTTGGLTMYLPCGRPV